MAGYFRRLRFLLAPILLASGCAHHTQLRQPPGVPPSPSSVTIAEPGGDAADAGLSALQRLTKEGWAYRWDRYDTIYVPLPDASKWTRMRFRGYPTRVGFRYGDDAHALVAMVYRAAPTKGAHDACLTDIVADVMPPSSLAKVHTDAPKAVSNFITSEPMSTMTFEADVGFVSVDHYVGAVASYTSWPRTCLLYGIAVVATDHPAEARAVVDRWVLEVAPAVFWSITIDHAPPFDAE